MSVINPILQAESLKIQANKVKEYAKKMVLYSEKLESKCTKFADEYGDLDALNNAPSEQFETEIESLNSRLRVATFCAYEALIEPQTFSSQRPASVAAIEDFKKYNDATEQIITLVAEDKLLIKLPLLWQKGRYTSWVNKHRVDYDYLQWFCANLDAALTLIDTEIPHFIYKNISYLFIRELVPSNAKNAADSDNYDTKKISDVITSHMLGGDSPSRCSFAYASAESEILNEGTYIAVSEGTNIAFDIEAQKAFWTRVLSR